MNYEVAITCAVTGAGDTADKHPDLPITPQQIADSAIGAAREGAAIVHCHVRNPETGKGSRDPALYKEVVDRIRSADVDVCINLTAGMGGDIEFGAGETPWDTVPENTDLVGPLERLIHVEELLPEICTLDCGTMNFGEGNVVVINTPDQLRAGARRIAELGVKPEMEVFDTGQLWFARAMVEEGLVESPPIFQICLGIPYGAPADTAHMKTMVDALPDGAIWHAFGISRTQMPMVAQAVLLGGNVRVGLEDNLYISRGQFASNAQLTERARNIVELMGARPLTAAEVRERFGLVKRG